MAIRRSRSASASFRAFTSRMRLLERDREVLEVDRLGDEVERAAVERGADVRHVAVGGDDDRAQQRVRLVEVAEQRQTVHDRHVDVGEHDVGLAVARRASPAPPRRCWRRRSAAPCRGSSLRNRCVMRSSRSGSSSTTRIVWGMAVLVTLPRRNGHGRRRRTCAWSCDGGRTVCRRARSVAEPGRDQRASAGRVGRDAAGRRPRLGIL